MEVEPNENSACYAISHPSSTPHVLLDDATVMGPPISSIKVILEVTLEGASARNYHQVSPEANVMLRVSCGPSMISSGPLRSIDCMGHCSSALSLPDLDIALSPFPHSRSLPPVSLRVYPVRLEKYPRSLHRLV